MASDTTLHRDRDDAGVDWEQYDRDAPYGYCHCGCGEKTPIAHRTDRINDMVRGQPRRYIHGHNRRVMPYPRGRVCKITREQADEIERRELAGERQVALSAEYGISQGQISRIARKKAWKKGDPPQDDDPEAAWFDVAARFLAGGPADIIVGTQEDDYERWPDHDQAALCRVPGQLLQRQQ